MRGGQVIGATDRIGGEATDRPVQFGEVFATLYHNLGIDVNKATVNDLTRPPAVPRRRAPADERAGVRFGETTRRRSRLRDTNPTRNRHETAPAAIAVRQNDRGPG